MRTPVEAALRLAQGLMWLAVSACSALLVYWLYVDPVYDRPWSSELGALVFAVLSIYAGVGGFTSLIDATRPSGDRRQRVPGTALPPQGIDAPQELQRRP